MIYKLFNKITSLITLKKKREYRFPEALVLKGYYFHEDKDVFKIIKCKLNDFESNIRELPVNDSLNQMHEIDREILLHVLVNNKKNEDLFTRENILRLVEYSRYYSSLTSLAKIASQNFYIELTKATIQAVHFHNISFKETDIHVKKYYNKTTKNNTLKKLYSIALDEITFENGTFSYNNSKLYTNVYNHIDSSLFENILKSKNHKRNIAINCSKFLKRIESIEKDGIPYKTYFPFYENSKINFKMFLAENKYIFWLETKEVNELANNLMRLFHNESKKDKKEIKNDITCFFSNNLNHPFKSTFIKNKKFFIYICYELIKNEKCNYLLLREFLIDKKLITKKLLNEYFQTFEKGKKPKKHQILKNFLIK